MRSLHCALFIPIISANTQTRPEGYFRLEWKLALDRSRLLADDEPFLLPIVIDHTSDATARVPDKFRQVQWTRLSNGVTPPSFVDLVSRLLAQEVPVSSVPPARPAVLLTRTSRARSWSRPALALMTALAVAGGGYVVVDKFSPSKHRAAATQTLVPAAGDGMAEEVLNLLAKIPGLKVIGRTSSFQFKGKTDDLRRVGAALNAVYIIEGSVRRSGERMRITAQLIDTRGGAHPWSQTYDRDDRDTIAVQDEIATGIVRALEVEVTSFPSRIRPKNDEAYEHYLRGLHAQDRFDEEGFNTAVAEFQHALGDDPAFAPAAEQLAMTKYFLAQWGFVPGVKGYAETLAAADAAIALDPRAAEAYNARATAELESTCNWRAADRDLTTALKIQPNSASILIGLAQERIVIGQYTEALRVLDADVARDSAANTTATRPRSPTYSPATATSRSLEKHVGQCDWIQRSLLFTNFRRE